MEEAELYCIGCGGRGAADTGFAHLGEERLTRSWAMNVSFRGMMRIIPAFGQQTWDTIWDTILSHSLSHDRRA